MILDQIQSSSFLDLTDTPSTYSGSAGKIVTVNSGSNGLEFTTATSGSYIGGISYDYFQFRGTDGDNAWYTANVTGGSPAAIGNITLSPNNLYAIPFIVPAGGTLDKIKIYISTAGAGDARFGIYKATSTTDLYPGDLITDCGTLSVAVVNTFPSITGLSISIGSSDLYWFVLVANVAFALLKLQTIVQSNCLGFHANAAYPIPGYNYPSSLIIKSFVYAAMPATFPAAGTFYGWQGVGSPHIMYHLSA